LEITLTNRPEERQRLHLDLEAFARKHGVPSNALQAADLALEEHLTNVFNHGFEQPEAHAVLIRLRTDPTWFVIEVEDDGKPFNPLAQPEVDISKPLAEKTVGGLGIHLIRQFMDELDYQRVEERNVLTMRKKLEQR
jgi:anti-sigma regulatory factor (Ser/Thr protein kinase)